MMTEADHAPSAEALERVVPDDFDGRYMQCPLCRRDNVRLRFYAGGVVLDEHSIPMPALAFPDPVDPDASHDMSKAKLVRIYCPASLSPVLHGEDA
jgi:hypothetical protein